MDFPLQLQFWTLVAALISLAFWLFRPPKKYIVTLSIFLALGLSDRAHGQAPAATACLSTWENDREMKLTQGGKTIATAVLDGLARRAGLQSVSCDYTMSLLDELRWDAYVVKQNDSSEAMESYLGTIDQELRKPGLSTGEVITKLVTISQVWRGASGLLIVESQAKGMPILLDGRVAGLTTWQRRLSPGIYSIAVLRGGRTVFSDRNVRIEDGKECRINIDAPR